MIKKTIVINFPGSGMPTQAFKNALHIFNIKRVHVNKVNAYVEFQKIKDYEAFRFTNFHGKIPSLHGATYNLVHPDFKWKFPSFNTYTIETLPKEEREETQPGSQDEKQRQDNVSQINGQKPQNIQNLLDEKNPKPIERIQDLEKALKIQRMRQQEQRKSVGMQTTGEDKDIQKNLISNKVSNLKMGGKNYRTLQSIIKTFIVENGEYWSNRMNIWVPLKEQLKEQGEVNEVMKEYGLTILLAIVVLIIFLM